MKRGVVVGIVAAGAVLIAAAGLVAWLVSRPPSAEAVAEDYLRALAAGDLARVEGLLAEDQDLGVARTAFSGADSYISDYTFDMDDADRGSRTVRAEVMLAAEPGVLGFVLIQQDGRWKVGGDHLAEVTIQTSIGDSVRIGGALVPAGAPVSLLPAVYTAVAAPADLVTGESSAAVTNERSVAMSVDATLSPNAVAAAQQQLDVYADACAEPAAAVPANCGLRIPWAADLATLSSIDFRIDAHPVVTIADDACTFSATGGDIVATATGTTREGVPGTFTYRAQDWALRGSIVFEGDEMVLAVR